MGEQMTEASLSFELRWTVREHVRAMRAMAKHRIGGRLWRVVKNIILSVIVILFLLTLWGASTMGPEAVVSLWPAALLTAFWVLYFTVGFSWFNALVTRRIDPNAKVPCVHRVSREGYHISSSEMNVDVRWNGVLRIVETDEFFLLFWSRPFAYYLPKRVVTPEAVPRLREMFVDSVGDKAHMSVV